MLRINHQSVSFMNCVFEFCCYLAVFNCVACRISGGLFFFVRVAKKGTSFMECLFFRAVCCTCECVRVCVPLRLCLCFEACVAWYRSVLLWLCFFSSSVCTMPSFCAPEKQGARFRIVVCLPNARSAARSVILLCVFANGPSFIGSPV